MEINAVQGVIKVTDFSMAGASQGFTAAVPLCWSREGSQRCQHPLKRHKLGTATTGHLLPEALRQPGALGAASQPTNNSILISLPGCTSRTSPVSCLPFSVMEAAQGKVRSSEQEARNEIAQLFYCHRGSYKPARSKRALAEADGAGWLRIWGMHRAIAFVNSSLSKQLDCGNGGTQCRATTATCAHKFLLLLLCTDSLQPFHHLS